MERIKRIKTGILCILFILARTEVLGSQHGPVAAHTGLKRLHAGARFWGLRPGPP